MYDEFGFGQAMTKALFVYMPVFGLFYALLIKPFYFKLIERQPYAMKALLMLQLVVVFTYRLFFKKLPLSQTFLTEFNTEFVFFAPHQHMTKPFFLTGIILFILLTISIERYRSKENTSVVFSDCITAAMCFIIFGYHIFNFDFIFS